MVLHTSPEKHGSIAIRSQKSNSALPYYSALNSALNTAIKAIQNYALQSMEVIPPLSPGERLHVP